MMQLTQELPSRNDACGVVPMVAGATNENVAKSKKHR